LIRPALDLGLFERDLAGVRERALLLLGLVVETDTEKLGLRLGERELVLAGVFDRLLVFGEGDLEMKRPFAPRAGEAEELLEVTIILLNGFFF
jgi:hypothetical protein